MLQKNLKKRILSCGNCCTCCFLTNVKQAKKMEMPLRRDQFDCLLNGLDRVNFFCILNNNTLSQNLLCYQILYLKICYAIFLFFENQFFCQLHPQNTYNKISLVLFYWTGLLHFWKHLSIRWSVIKRPTDSTTGTTSGQTDTMSRQTSTTNGQTNGQTGTASRETSTTSR